MKEVDSRDTEEVKQICVTGGTMILLRQRGLREDFSFELVKFDVLPRHFKC